MSDRWTPEFRYLKPWLVAMYPPATWAEASGMCLCGEVYPLATGHACQKSRALAPRPVIAQGARP